MTDRVDALNAASKDVAGAGDSLLIESAMTLANPPGNLANGAVYILSAELLEKMGKELHAVKDFSMEVLHRFVGRIYSHETSEVFLDIGTPENYAKANS